jgi:uncharacterized protein YdbL (DUF1318 family)
MKRSITTSLAAIVALIAGCVVIPNTFDANINVTIRHIQEQADGILDFVSGASDELPAVGAAPGSNDKSMLQNILKSIDPVRTAYAAEINESSPRVQQIANSMRTRFNDIEAAKKTGAVGENNRGFLEMRNPDAIADATKRNEVQRVIAADNEDRKALYQEIARLNSDQNLTVGTVERIYAQKRLERAKSGELFQLPPAGADFDAFAASPTGKKLGGAAKPGEWVTIP